MVFLMKGFEGRAAAARGRGRREGPEEASRKAFAAGAQENLACPPGMCSPRARAARGEKLLFHAFRPIVRAASAIAKASHANPLSHSGGFLLPQKTRRHRTLLPTPTLGAQPGRQACPFARLRPSPHALSFPLDQAGFFARYPQFRKVVPMDASFYPPLHLLLDIQRKSGMLRIEYSFSILSRRLPSLCRLCGDKGVVAAVKWENCIFVL